MANRKRRSKTKRKVPATPKAKVAADSQIVQSNVTNKKKKTRQAASPAAKPSSPTHKRVTRSTTAGKRLPYQAGLGPVKRKKARHPASIPKSGQSVYINQMPAECLSLILRQFVASPRDLIHCRRVSALWNNMVRVITGWTRSVRINLLSETSKSGATELKSSYRRLYFELLCNNPQPAKQKTITLHSNHFNEAVAHSIGTLYREATHLVIQCDLPDKRTMIRTMRTLLKPFCKVVTFSLIMSRDITNPNFLPAISHAIEVSFPNLRRLDLFISDYNVHKMYGFHKIQTSLIKTISRLQHFSMSCATPDFFSIWAKFGKYPCQCDFPCDDPEDCDLMYIPPLSASIQCRMHTVDIARLFKVNPILRFLPHLQMTAVWSVEMVGKFMDNFPMLESLQLCHCRTNSGIFDSEWIAALRPLLLLRTLKLVDFGIDVAAQLVSAELPTVKQLTLVGYNLLTYFKQQTSMQEFDGALFCQLLSCQFPWLELLELIAYEPEDQVFDLAVAISEAAWQNFKSLKELKLNLRAPILKGFGAFPPQFPPAGR